MPFLYAVTLFLSAALLMVVQPLCARLLLPSLGGTPNVWNTCMVFFETGLLVGYACAHANTRWLGSRGSVFVQVALLTLGFWLLPIALPSPLAPPTTPVVWLLGALGAGVALPYTVLAATGPLLQRWFAAGALGSPYFLFAASNAGSFVGLLAYPLVIEPWLTLPEQSAAWRWGYLILAVFTVVCGAALLRRRPIQTPMPNVAQPPQPLSWSRRLRWLLLALAPSSLLLSVTNHLTTDIAAMPLLWIVPLSLYLLSFIVVFATRPPISHQVVTRWQPLAVIVLMLLILREPTEPLAAVLTLHLLGFFWLALACHGELADDKPAPERLTEFYLWLALGGALGGVLNALVAPLVFNGFAEYPLILALAAALKPSNTTPTGTRFDWLAPALLGAATTQLVLLSRWLRLDPTLGIILMYLAPLAACYLLQGRAVRFGMAVAAVFLASMLDPGVHGPAAYRTRSFFGVHRVTDAGGLRRLVHGNTIHGQQFLDKAKRREALAYYHKSGPIGKLLTALRDDPRLQRVGLIGLGAGSLAAYVEPGHRWTFFEIDPAVVHIARDSGLFTFLADSPPGAVDVVLGDARLTLAQSSEMFGLLVIDAFGSDAIPWHLLTREALQLYRNRLQPGGILAFHISNKYVDLEPILANHAQEMGWFSALADDRRPEHDPKNPGVSGSIWLFLAENAASFGPMPDRWPRGQPNPDLRVWTDDYANLLQVIRWRAEP